MPAHCPLLSFFLSGDSALVAALGDGDFDPFEELARRFFDISPDAEVGAGERTRAKQACYAILYGVGARSLARSMRTTIERAQLLLDCTRTLLKPVVNWQEAELERAIEAGKVEVRSQVGRVVESYRVSIRAAPMPWRGNTLCGVGWPTTFKLV